MSPLADDVMLGYVTWADRLQPTPWIPACSTFSLGELALRVARDPDFADRLLALTPATTLVGN